MKASHATGAAAAALIVGLLLGALLLRYVQGRARQLVASGGVEAPAP